MDRTLKIVFALAFFGVGLGLYFSIRYGIAPKPVPLIKATEVSSLTEAGVLAYKRMRQENRATNVIVAGVSPFVVGYQEFWQGWVLAAREDDSGFDQIMTTPGARLFREAQVMNQKEYEDKDTQTLMSDKKQRYLVYTNFNQSSHLNDNGLSQMFESKRRKAVLLTQHRFWPFREKVDELGLNCEGDGQNKDLRLGLDCLAEFVSRQHFRKNLDPSKSYLALYRFGRQDYIIFHYQPGE